MVSLLGGLWAGLAAALDLSAAALLAAFAALGLRLLVLALAERQAGWPAVTVRLAGAAAFLSAAGLYGAFTAPSLRWGAGAAVLALAVLLAVGAATAWRLRSQRRPGPGRPRSAARGRPPGLLGGLAQTVALLALLLLACLTLMRAGFLALTEDRPVLLVELTGETAVERVSWAPPNAPLRSADLTTHRVLLKTPAGEALGDAWVYGDQVAIKGRVLRLSPLLNAAGVPNLFELQFLHNGYQDAERHASLPPLARPLPPLGPLAVHPWWRPVQRRLLERWEQGSGDGSPWMLRSLTIESTYFPLLTPAGQPVRGQFRLVLTPGGLTQG